MRRSVFLVADAAAARVARMFAAAVLADWKLTELTDDLDVCVTELTSNAYRHAEGNLPPNRGEHSRLIRVTLDLLGPRLRVQVRDGSSRPPVMRPWPSPESSEPGSTPDVAALPESGAGLHLVQELSDGWSWRHVPGGKITACWFILR